MEKRSKYLGDVSMLNASIYKDPDSKKDENYYRKISKYDCIRRS
jgi:hypothetical protein